MLPDEIPLAIFDFCGNENDITGELEAWETLVHVCRRWRSVVFGSPRRFNLQLVCSSGTPARDMLDVWPALPLVLLCDSAYPIDNIVAVLVARAQQSRASNRVLRSLKLVFGKDFGGDAGAIPGADRSGAHVVRRNGASPSRFVLGWICPEFAKTLVEWRPISGITETAFVGRSPRRSYPLANSSFRILFIRGHAHCPLHADQPPISLA